MTNFGSSQITDTLPQIILTRQSQTNMNWLLFLPFIFHCANAVAKSYVKTKGSSQSCPSVNPSELVGIWTGPDKFVEKDGESGVLCSILITPEDGTPVYLSAELECAEVLKSSTLQVVGALTPEELYSESTLKLSCEGPGKGTIYGFDCANGYICDKFERKGNKLHYAYGFFSESLKDVVCPKSADSDPFVDPHTYGAAQFLASGENIDDPSLFSCQ
eukprot:TRINITY_DN35804_c0_g1_i1.p2 TRINITY_DN35804_c0_g1~~TRINITY_DN35804_c0_g1_i1.p2  ORF type:complete len:217 (+),score=28.73 TRINITY_DN35804_c0_g1_i1:76-726(+)